MFCRDCFLLFALRLHHDNFIAPYWKRHGPVFHYIIKKFKNKNYPSQYKIVFGLQDTPETNIRTSLGMLDVQIYTNLKVTSIRFTHSPCQELWKNSEIQKTKNKGKKIRRLNSLSFYKLYITFWSIRCLILSLETFVSCFPTKIAGLFSPCMTYLTSSSDHQNQWKPSSLSQNSYSVSKNWSLLICFENLKI